MAEPLTKTPTETFEDQLSFVVTHYKLAKAILPALEQEPSSSYTIITGSAGTEFEPLVAHCLQFSSSF